MSFKEKYPVGSLINENEEEVFKAIDKVLAGGNKICTCRDCMLDVVAIALNNLQPNYRVFLMRPVHRESEIVHDHLEKVEEAVRKAVLVVKKRPHHRKKN